MMDNVSYDVYGCVCVCCCGGDYDVSLYSLLLYCYLIPLLHLSLPPLQMVSAESEFQVRHRPKIDKVVKPRSRIATGDGGRGGRIGRRESAAGSLEEFAEMNTDSGIFNAVTMEEISVGARYYRELNVSVCMYVCVCGGLVIVMMVILTLIIIHYYHYN